MTDTSTTKKRKSGIPTLREWEKINLERFALSRVKALTNLNEGAFQDRLDALEKDIQQQKRKETVFIKKGYESVLLFLKNPKLIPIMKKEMALRSKTRHAGGDILFHDFSEPTLSRHCQLQATAIFTRNDSSCEDCSYSYHYLRVRSNYAETMGRASWAVEQALNLYGRIKERTTVKEEQKIPVQDAPEQQTFPNYWENFNRPSEREVDELLNNKCDDNVDDERDMEEPKKVSTSKLKQMEFDFQNQRQ